MSPELNMSTSWSTDLAKQCVELNSKPYRPKCAACMRRRHNWAIIQGAESAISILTRSSNHGASLVPSSNRELSSNQLTMGF
jgi:hypothetical protein